MQEHIRTTTCADISCSSANQWVGEGSPSPEPALLLGEWATASGGRYWKIVTEVRCWEDRALCASSARLALHNLACWPQVKWFCLVISSEVGFNCSSCTQNGCLCMWSLLQAANSFLYGERKQYCNRIEKQDLAALFSVWNATIKRSWNRLAVCFWSININCLIHFMAHYVPQLCVKSKHMTKLLSFIYLFFLHVASSTLFCT